jgi:hypothetical protein
MTSTLVCRPVVAAAVPGFHERFEGFTRYPYCDVKNFLTIGVGCLIDPVNDEVLSLPWEDEFGNPVGPDIVSTQLGKLKTAGLAGRLAGYQSQFSTIRLSYAGVNTLVEKRVAIHDEFLARRFLWYAGACADAQLGVLSMAWPMGPGFQFPKFEETAAAGQWAVYTQGLSSGKRVLTGGAAVECRISTVGNPGVAPRNSANQVLFENAAAVASNGWAEDQIYWPVVLS